MIYGKLPVNLGVHEVFLNEMTYYQYLPIKNISDTGITIEDRLQPLKKLIGNICCYYVGKCGLDNYIDSYVYLTVKNMFQTPGCSFNRNGWHSDGFMTNDINFIWSDVQPTLFNLSKFNLSMDDIVSMEEMEQQAEPDNDVTFPNGTLLMLDQFSIHKVSPIKETGMRCFIKISFSKDKYDLKGNSINHLMNLNWEMRDRKKSRNIPQKTKDHE